MKKDYINKAITLIIAGIFLFTGCGNGEDLFKEGKVEEYNQISRKVDAISSKFKPSGNSSEASNAQTGSINYSEQTAKALDMADDMALAQTFNLLTNEMLVKAGEAVKAYPHPLLLNNYAAMLYGRGQENDALYFFQLSLNQQPDNTVLLTNVANVYLDRENYSEAQQYAKRALAVTPDYGPAYQVLTTIHLKDKNSGLAAETMIKGAKQCFNSITIYHFESFLDAVSELDPLKDDYPLKEEFINDLYDIARENVDTKAADSSVDSPKGQIKLKQFPQITGANNLMKSSGYLDGEINKIADKNSDAEKRYDKYYEALSKHFDNEAGKSEGTVPVVGNARQIYAIKVLQSYYLYKIKQTEAKLNKKLDEIKGDREEKLDNVSEKDYLNMEEAEEKAENAGDKLLWGIFKGIFDEGGLPDTDDAMNKTMKRENLRIQQLETELTTSKQFSEEIIDEAQKAYNDMKQIFEEYWLKTGGVLKYINNEDVFNQLDLEREKTVYEYIWIPLAVLKEEAEYLNNIKRQRDDAEKESLILMGGMQEALAQLEEEKRKEAEKEKEKKGEDMVPDIEKEAISEYPENNVLGDLGAEVDLFGMVGASFQFNGTDKLNIEIDSTLGVVSGEISNSDGKVQKETYIATGVRAEGSTDWFTDTNVVKKALGSSGAVGKVLGKVSFGFKNGIRTGEYIVTDDNNRVIDRGMMHIRETGGEIGMFSRTTQVIVKKSYMTGLATKKTVVKNKFSFVTYSK